MPESSAASGVTRADGEDEMLRHYSAALDEIWRLRSAMAYEAGVLAVHLDYKTFPKSRRASATEQLARMTAAASGSAATPYSQISSRSLEHARRLAGVGTLTRHKWESR